MNLWHRFLRKFWPHSHLRPEPITTDSGLLLMLSRTGPIFVWEMRQFGVTWAHWRAHRLLESGYLQRERCPGGWLYGLTEMGGREVRRMKGGR